MYWFTSACLEVPPLSSRLTPEASPTPYRDELVARIRREIAEGVYETQEKWETVLDRVFERLAQP
jgi:hypothetical protein